MSSTVVWLEVMKCMKLEIDPPFLVRKASGMFTTATDRTAPS